MEMNGQHPKTAQIQRKQFQEGNEQLLMLMLHVSERTQRRTE